MHLGIHSSSQSGQSGWCHRSQGVFYYFFYWDICAVITHIYCWGNIGCQTCYRDLSWLIQWHSSSFYMTLNNSEIKSTKEYVTPPFPSPSLTHLITPVTGYLSGSTLPSLLHFCSWPDKTRFCVCPVPTSEALDDPTAIILKPTSSTDRWLRSVLLLAWGLNWALRHCL